MMARKITVNVPSEMCFQVMGDSNPQIQVQNQYAKQGYQYFDLGTYKAYTNLTVSTTGALAYWKC